MKPPINKSVLFLTLLMLSSSVFGQVLSTNQLRTMRSMAEAFERSGNVRQAAELYMRANLANPKDISTYLGAQRLLLRLGEFDRLEQFIQQLQEKRRDVRYAIDLANIDYQRGNEELALKQWQTIIKENPRNQQAYALVGRVMVENQLYEQAVDLYKKGRTTFDNPSLFIFDLANIYKAQNKTDELIQEYLGFLKHSPTQIHFIQNEIRALASAEGTTERLIKTIEKAQKKSPEFKWATLLFLGDLYTQAENYELALNNYIELEQLLADTKASQHYRRWQAGQFVYNFAETALNDNKLDVAEPAFQLIVTQYDTTVFKDRAELGLAHVFLQRKDYSQAINALSRFVETNPKSQTARMALSQIGDIYLNELFQVEAAEDAYLKCLQAYPDPREDIFTLISLYDCAIAGNDLAKAEAYLQRALKKANGKQADLRANVYLQFAQLELYQKRPGASLDFLTKFSEAPQNPQPNVLENDALELGMLLNENRQDSTSLAVYGQARLFLKQHKYDEARSLLEQHLQEQLQPSMKDELQLLLVSAYEKNQDYKKALDVLRAIYENEQSFYRDFALLSMADLSQSAFDDQDTSLKYYEQLLVEFPNSIYLEDARKKIRQFD